MGSDAPFAGKIICWDIHRRRRCPCCKYHTRLYGETLAAREMKKVELTAVISSASLKKLQNHEPVSLNVLMRISEALDVPIEKIVEFRRI